MMRRRVEADTRTTVVPAFRQEDIGVAFRFKASITASLARELDACMAAPGPHDFAVREWSAHLTVSLVFHAFSSREPLHTSLEKLRAKRNYFSPTHGTAQISLKWLAKLVLSRSIPQRSDGRENLPARANQFTTSRDTPLIS
jgi:hypothetical protein